MSRYLAKVGTTIDNNRLWVIVAVTAIAAYMVLFWSFPHPPLIDWPNHMARHYLESLALAGKPLPAGYEIHYALVPNLGADLLMPLLLQVFSVTTASRIFLISTIIVSWLGFDCFIRHRAGAKVNASFAALLALPWLLYPAFFWGFLNYVSSIGLAFLVFCNYQRIAGEQRPGLAGLIGQGLLIALLYIWHLVGLAVYLILHGSFLLSQLVAERQKHDMSRVVRDRLVPAVVMFAPLLLLVITVHLTKQPSALVGDLEWASLSQKLRNMATYFTTYNILLDAVVMVLWVAAVIAMLRIEKLRSLQWDWLHVAVLGFLIGFLVLPYDMGSTSGIDVRLLPPMFVCVLGLAARLPVRNVRMGAILVLAATMLRLISITSDWSAKATIEAQHLAFIRSLPMGARISVVQLAGSSRLRSEAHMASWAVPERNAMVTSLFAIAGQQPLQLATKKEAPLFTLTSDGAHIDPARIRSAAIDYVWVFNPLNLKVDLPQQWPVVHDVYPIKVWKVD